MKSYFNFRYLLSHILIFFCIFFLFITKHHDDTVITYSEDSYFKYRLAVEVSKNKILISVQILK
jgi:hypothetical protein